MQRLTQSISSSSFRCTCPYQRNLLLVTLDDVLSISSRLYRCDRKMCFEVWLMNSKQKPPFDGAKRNAAQLNLKSNRCKHSACHWWWSCVKTWLIYSVAALCAHWTRFEHFCTFCSLLEAASDVISGKAVERLGMDARVKFGDSWSNISWSIRSEHLDTNNEVRTSRH